jgi:hypothetical protein
MLKRDRENIYKDPIAHDKLKTYDRDRKRIKRQQKKENMEKLKNEQQQLIIQQKIKENNILVAQAVVNENGISYLLFVESLLYSFPGISIYQIHKDDPHNIYKNNIGISFFDSLTNNHWSNIGEHQVLPFLISVPYIIRDNLECHIMASIVIKSKNITTCVIFDPISNENYFFSDEILHSFSKWLDGNKIPIIKTQHSNRDRIYSCSLYVYSFFQETFKILQSQPIVDDNDFKKIIVDISNRESEGDLDLNWIENGNSDPLNAIIRKNKLFLKKTNKYYK